jgi:uncharacterized repeat protein (TIGR03803 family)
MHSAHNRLRNDRIRNRLTMLCVLFLMVIVIALSARPTQAQTETVLYSFTGLSDGGEPSSNLTADAAGDFYGTTGGGGLGFGTVFEISPNGAGGWIQSVLHSFTGGTDGAYPAYSPVIFDGAGNLYGTTEWGGAYGYGVVFELSPKGGGNWTEIVLYSFANAPDGANPLDGVIIDPSGNLFGTTERGGPGSATGAVFELSPSGSGWTEQVINPAYWGLAAPSGLTRDGYGRLFFVSSGFLIFVLSPNLEGGWDITLASTSGSSSPANTLTYNGYPTRSSNVFGTSDDSPPYSEGSVFQLIGPRHNLTKQIWRTRTLYTFHGSAGRKNGSHPCAGITFGPDAIYGTTADGGKYGQGTLFELVSTRAYHSSEKILLNFDGTGGENPCSGLSFDSAGNLYGTTTTGGLYGAGVVYEVTP